MHQVSPDTITNLTNLLWYFLLTFWTISGAASTLAAGLPAPVDKDDKDASKKNAILSSKIYSFFYHATNIVAQNLAWAKNLNDPRVRGTLNLVVKTLAGAFVASAATTAVSESDTPTNTAAPDTSDAK